MNFRRLEIIGFKSFADRLEIVFEPGITAIVGPNGCGKSNISDAIKWVLGEQNPRSIRCEKMEDLIFNGGANRRPLGMAQVTLTISNQNKEIPSEYTEIEIERRFFRSGESEYYINRNRCLLKDIQDLFMDTGLGANSYAIMEQGHIDLILNSSPQDRRLILEEAAGITRFRHRKRTAIKKLEATEQNITRLNDIIVELEQQVNSLKRQEAKARTYQRYYNELKKLDLIISKRKYMSELHQLERLNTALAEIDDKENALVSSISSVEAEIELKKLEMTELEAKLSDLRVDQRKLQSQIEETESSIAVLNERKDNLQRRIKTAIDESTKIRAKLKELDDRISTMDVEKSRLNDLIASQEGELESLQESANKLTKSVGESEKLLDDLKSQSIALLKERSKCQNEISVIDSKLEYLDSRIERIQRNEESFHIEQSQLEQSIAKIEEDMLVREKELSSLLSKQEELKGVIQQLRSRSSQLEAEIRNIEKDRSAKVSRLQSLRELQRSYEGYGSGVKFIFQNLKGKKDNQPEIQGIVGVLAELIRTQPQYEVAVESSLGDMLQSIVMERIDDVLKVLIELNQGRGGRATFIALDQVPRNGQVTPVNLPFEPDGCEVIPAIAVLEFNEMLSPVLNHLLRNVFLVDDLDTAVKISKSSSDPSVRLVTMDGQIIQADGIITGGAGTRSPSLLKRIREIHDLEAEISMKDEELSKLLAERDEVNKNLTNSERHRDAVAKQIQATQMSQVGMQRDLSQYKQRLSRLQKEMSVLKNEKESLGSDVEKLRGQRVDLTNNLESIETKARELNDKIEVLQNEMRSSFAERDELIKRCNELRIQLASKKQQEKGLTENILSLKKEKESLIKTLEHLESSISSDNETEREVSKEIMELEELLEKLFINRTDLETQISTFESHKQNLYIDLSSKEELLRENRREIDRIRQERHQLEVSRTEIQMNISFILAKVRERYGISLKEITSEQSEIGSELTDKELDSMVQDLQSKIERLGPVNLNAIEEYSRQKERYDLLITQREDLVKAKESLYGIIQRINRESREKLKETFDMLNANFQDFFQRMFGGGHAELVMVGEEDILESGIEIIARPPGKKPQTVSMLSTGERALTAIAILFALFRIKPSPFCIMDEVDAALDDANIGRFTSMLKEFSANTQFVIITHNKRTMEIADVLYGITMEEAGISKLVSFSFNNSLSNQKAKAS